MSEKPGKEEELSEAARTRRERRSRFEREGERSVAQNLAMIGALGWTIVLPTFLGILAGRWLDRHLDMGVFWTFSLLVAGLVLGCVLAWKRMQSK